MAQSKGLEQDEYRRLATRLDDKALLAAHEQSRGEGDDTKANMLLSEINRRELDL